LRKAILDANANAGADVINFSVAGTIQLTSGALPFITSPLTLDGSTAPGFSSAPVIEIDYNHFGGLLFNPGSAGSILRSLSLVNASGSGVTLNGGGHLLIAGNYIGLELDGTTMAGNGGNGLELDASSNNIIGGTTAADRNVISGNNKNGIAIGLSGSTNNQVDGNYIGTDATGTLDRGNTLNGVLVTYSASGNTIGTTQGNVISGNDGNGVLITVMATQTTVSGNLIGLTASGNTALGNLLDGVKIDHASNNLIGHSDPVTGVTYNNAQLVPTQPVTGWQGIRNSDTPSNYLIAGTSSSDGLLFDGDMAGVGLSYLVDFPSAATTSVYGPDNLGSGNLRLVGSYKNPDYATAPVTVNGFIYEGTTSGFSTSGNYKTIDHPGAQYNYVHSTMGGFAVGNYDSQLDHGLGNLPLGPGHAFLYDVAQGKFLTDIVFPNSKSNTAYGIWYNGGTSYTICGGYSHSVVNNFEDQSQPIGQGYLVDYDSVTHQFTHWTSFTYPNGKNFITHFEGISSVEKGVYTLSADSVQAGSANPVQGSFVSVRRNANGSFGPGTWVNLNYTGLDPTNHITSSNAVYGNQVVGIVISSGSSFSFQATVNVGFQLSNVIGGNACNGVGLYAANNNQVAMNYIGTDVTGTLALANAKNGIRLTTGAQGNMIGGQATGGNDPTNNVFVRPPQGNLISGNSANGVLINGGATLNTLSGNFIGTDSSGSSALGNSLDGVDIANADGNSLIGCTFQQDPFVFYNVISGNGANGLQVTDSNSTTIQANFLGIGADNLTPLGNVLNGVVVEGTSADTVMGGPIPLGNVDAANGQNGLLVQGTASFFTTYNTFCGLAAFQTYTNLGNGLDGMKITSTGGNILIRTNVITENANDGIEIAGAATGVRVAGNIIGLDTQGNVAMGNKNNGVEVGGAASNIVIGGPQATFNIIPHNAISSNGNNGVAIDGIAHNIVLNFSYIGTDLTGLNAGFGNTNDGVYLGPGTNANQIGSANPSLPTVISSNHANGVEMLRSDNNVVIGCLIGIDALGLLPLPNLGNGIAITISNNNVIGRNLPASGPANTIAFNHLDGVFIESGTGNSIRDNSIYSNNGLGIDLTPFANMNQAAPVLTSVQKKPLGLQVAGSLASRANTTFTLEFFANNVSDPSGRYFLGSLLVSTNAAGVAAFAFNGLLPPSGADFITATATDPAGNTSEFSAPVS
jgi:hypothetical protein